MFKKGQAATEYLIILAVVIVIALIVIGVMGGIPGIGTGATGRASAAYWASADVAFASYAITNNGATDSLTLNVKNNLRNSINLSSISIGGTGIDFTSVTLAAGETTTITDTNIGNLCSAGGASFSLAVAINYTDQATSASYSFDGGGTKLEGTCAG